MGLTRPRLLWITNHPSPYRLPAWSCLAAQIDLTLAFVGKPHANRPPWVAPAEAAFTVQHLAPWGASASSDSGRSGLVSPREVLRLKRATRPTAVMVPAWGDLAAAEMALLIGHRIPHIGFYGTSAATRHASGPVARARGRALRGFDALVSYGTETTRLLADDRVPAERIVTGFNTVDAPTIAREVREARARGGAEPGHHRFVFVGQLVERKAPELAVEALAAPGLERETLTIVGAGPERGTLERIAQELGVADRVDLVGIVSPEEMPAVLAEHHTLVMPSRREVWGLVANEALAAGMHAVVSTTAGCATDLASHEGVFLAAPTQEDITAAMIASRDRWTGWIDRPAIVDIGPERLAADVVRALEIAGGHR